MIETGRRGNGRESDRRDREMVRRDRDRGRVRERVDGIER